MILLSISSWVRCAVRFLSKKASTASPEIRRRLFLGLLALPIASACQPTGRANGVRVGDVYPNFELPDLQRHRRKFAEFAGGPLLVNFWATWCPPCRDEMAGLQVLHERLQSSGGGVVAISVDDDINLVREFVLQTRVSFPVLLDAGKAFASGVLALQAYPTSFLLRSDGRVGEVVVGVRSWETSVEHQRVLAVLS
jgi:peroxiredoxin